MGKRRGGEHPPGVVFVQGREGVEAVSRGCRCRAREGRSRGRREKRVGLLVACRCCRCRSRRHRGELGSLTGEGRGGVMRRCSGRSRSGRGGSRTRFDARYGGSNAKAREESRLALRLQAAEERGETVGDVLAVDGLSVKDRDRLIEQVHDLGLAVLDDADGEGFEEKGRGEEDALEDARGGDTEVPLRSEVIAGFVENGLGSGEGVQDPLTFLKVEEGRRYEPEVVSLYGERSASEGRGGNEEEAHLDCPTKTFLQSAKSDRVPVQASVHELHLQQRRLDVASLCGIMTVSKRREGEGGKGRTKNDPRLELHHLQLVLEGADEALPVTATDHAPSDLLVRIEALLDRSHELERTNVSSELRVKRRKKTNGSDQTLRKGPLRPHLAQPLSSNVLTRSTRHLLPPRRRHVCNEDRISATRRREQLGEETHKPG